jgi:hypothetical protein
MTSFCPGSQAPAWEPVWVQSSALLKNRRPLEDIPFAKRSLVPLCVPKQELGDERKDLTKRFPAWEIIKVIAPAIGGSGGGRPDMAQAGGPDKDKIPAALEQVYEVVAQRAKG